MLPFPQLTVDATEVRVVNWSHSIDELSWWKVFCVILILARVFLPPVLPNGLCRGVVIKIFTIVCLCLYNPCWF